MSLPEAVVALLRGLGGGAPERARRVGGGSINHAALVSLAGGREVFVKWHPGAAPGFFGAEADGLRRLEATGTVRVPEVLGVLDEGAVPALVLEALEVVGRSEAAMADAGRRLAALHGTRGLAPGLERDNIIGSLPQANGAASDGRWLTFFGERRLGALAYGLPAGPRRRLEALIPNLSRWLSEPEGGCALLHGDLWSGNLVCTRAGAGVLVDPAVYAGHPEVDLAMTRLFGGFSSSFYGAYQEVAGRFDPELDARLELYNLYPLLVHVHLFGGGYVGQVEATLRRFGG